MQKAIFLCVITLLTQSVYSQKLERIIIKGGSGYWQSLKREIYQYPVFLKGTIRYKNGESLLAQMNYHKGLDQIHIIYGKDTVPIINYLEIKSVTIDNDSFF